MRSEITDGWLNVQVLFCVRLRIYPFERRMTVSVRWLFVILAIVSSLIKRYHGSIRVEDRVPGQHSKGAKFVIELPMA